MTRIPMQKAKRKQSEDHVVGPPSSEAEILASDNRVIREAYSKRIRMCVQWRDDKGMYQWCAIKNKKDPKAVSDATLCNHFVRLRGGSERREPTCAECLSLLDSIL